MTDERELMIGVGRSDITPPVGTELHGGPRRVSDSVRDPLYATAIVLEDGARRVALVVCDLLHFPDDFLRAAIADIEAATGLAAEDILLSATHSHSGPTLDEPYGTALRGKLCECMAEACGGMRPCRVGGGSGVVEGVAVSQREQLPEGETSAFGSIINGDGWDRPVDTELGVLRFDDPGGDPIAAGVNFSCHSDNSPADDTVISSEFPGEVRRVIEAATGATALFVQGCCGNIGMIGRWFQMPTREAARAESYDMTRRAGRKIAGEALKVFEAIDTRARRHHRARAEDRHMDWVFEDVDTPSVTNLGMRSRRFTAPPFEERPDQAARTGEVRVMVVNDIALVGIPGDTYAEIGMEIRQRSRSRHTLVLGLTNGLLSYIPVPEAYDEGGYSVAAAKSANTGPGTARIVIETALDLIEELMRGDA